MHPHACIVIQRRRIPICMHRSTRIAASHPYCIHDRVHARAIHMCSHMHMHPCAVDELYTTPCASACIRELLMISCALVVPDPIDASTHVDCDSKAPYTHMHAQIHAHSWIDHHFILPRRAAPTVMQATAGIRAPPPVLHACATCAPSCTCGRL